MPIVQRQGQGQRQNQGLGQSPKTRPKTQMLVMVVVLALATVWLRLSIVSTTYAISETDRQIRNASIEREQWALKLAATKSPRQLEKIAKNKQGFVQPDRTQVVYLK